MMDSVTNIRASIMLMTCITILAVDFQVGDPSSHVVPVDLVGVPGLQHCSAILFSFISTSSCTQVFPRRFAKTEVFGTGLMDLGVGATIFSSGLASGCRARRQSRQPKPGWSVWRAVLADTAATAIRAWPLAALGVSRLVVIKGLGYQEHVSEYGVHWNFFATLFVIRLVVVSMSRLSSARLRYYLALAAICVYQWFLVHGGLSDFIVHAPRDSLFAMNREGVLGLVGFVAIYYIAQDLGSQIQAQRHKTDEVSLCHVPQTSHSLFLP